MRVLLAEDEPRVAADVATALERSGYAVDRVGDGEAAWFHGDTEDYDAAVLDLGLPKLDGLTVLKRWRSAGRRFPVLVLTARGAWTERVEGIDSGADDYLPKPFEPRELLARLRAVLRRQQAPGADSMRTLSFGRLEIDLGARTVRLDGEARAVTGYQFDLLVAMAERAGRVLSREQLMEAVKGEALEAFDRSIDVHIGRLRAAIEDDPRRPKRIVTVRGSGYVFAKVQDV